MRKYNENAMFVRLFRITTRVAPRRSNLEKGGLELLSELVITAVCQDSNVFRVR